MYLNPILMVHGDSLASRNKRKTIPIEVEFVLSKRISLLIGQLERFFKISFPLKNFEFFFQKK